MTALSVNVFCVASSFWSIYCNDTCVRGQSKQERRFCTKEILKTRNNLSYLYSPEEVAPLGVGDGGDGDGDGGEDRDVGRGGGVGVRGVAEEEGAEAHALGDVAVAVRLALLVEHLVLGRAAATRYLAFWNKAGVSDGFSRGNNIVSVSLRHPSICDVSHFTLISIESY